MEAMEGMPTVDDLRKMARDTYANLRGKISASSHCQYHDDLRFIHKELIAIGRSDVYHAENRRHELLLRGFTPPEEIAPY